eukprot:m.26033 g.26033  ORF g.26033 m.26033 type:complete len:132 (+) comp29074_c0_seq1:324-719(+)
MGQMLTTCNISLAPLPLTNPIYVDDAGTDVMVIANAAATRLNAAIAGLTNDWKTGQLTENDNPSLHAALRLHGWHPKNYVEEALEIYYFDGSFGLTPTAFSTTYYYNSYGAGGQLDSKAAEMAIRSLRACS